MRQGSPRYVLLPIEGGPTLQRVATWTLTLRTWTTSSRASARELWLMVGQLADGGGPTRLDS